MEIDCYLVEVGEIIVCCIGVLRRNRTNKTQVEIQVYIVYHKELAYMITEAEKPHDLPRVSCRPRVAGGVSSCQSVRRPTDAPARKWSGSENEFFLTPPFCSIQAPLDWLRPTRLGGGNLLYLVHQFKY